MEAVITSAIPDAAQLRASLHHLVDETDDAAVLQALLTLLNSTQPAALAADHTVRLEDLSPAERTAVKEGLRQLDAGEGRPHAEVWAEFEAEFGVKSPQWK